MSKRFQMVGLRGSTWSKSRSDIFGFGYGKASTDKMVPDPVGSGPLFVGEMSVTRKIHEAFMTDLLEFSLPLLMSIDRCILPCSLMCPPRPTRRFEFQKQLLLYCQPSLG
jgi:hypothetical protein